MGISVMFAFVLANKCAVFVWLVFSYPSCFFILTVIVYLDTIGCVIAKMLSVTVYLDTTECVMAKI